MVKYFYGNRSFVLLGLPILIGLYIFCNNFTGYVKPPDSIDIGLWGTLNIRPHFLLDLLSPSVVFITAIIANRLFNGNQFMEKNNYLVALLFVVISSFFSPFYFLGPYAFVQLLLMLMLLQLFKLNQNEDGRRAVFNASFLFGVAATLYPLLLLGFPFLLWMIWVLRPFVFREAALSLIGLLIPLIYVASYYLYLGQEFNLTFFNNGEIIQTDIDLLGLAGCLLLLGLLSLNELNMKLRVSSIRLKKLFRMVFVFGVMITGLMSMEFILYHNKAVFILGVLPLMYFLPYAFGTKELRASSTILFYILFVFSFARFFLPEFQF